MDPHFGISIRRTSDEPRPVIGADMDTIGIIGPADDADVDVFPLNVNVKGYSDDPDFVLALGDDGFLADAVRGINDQLADMQRAAQLIIRRTARGVNADPALANQLTIANILGSSAARTGIYGFLDAPEDVQAVPRIILTPGYTGLLATGVSGVTMTTPGTGYTAGTSYPLTFTAGGANAVQATGHAIGQLDGSLGDAVIDTPGAWYASAPTVAAPDPDAAGPGTPATFTATIGTLANPIVASLPAVLDQLLAHAVAESAGTSQANDEAWRETINSDRIIPLSGGVKVLAADGSVVTMPYAPRIAGAMVRVDHMTGGPFNSVANQPIFGILGPARRINYSLTDGANEGNALLRSNIGILVSGSLGNDFALASGGYIAIVLDNAGEDELWRFYNQTRGRDYIHLMTLRFLRYYLGRFNVSVQTVQAIINGLRFMIRDLVADNSIIGGRADFVGGMNSAENIRKGIIRVSFRAEEPAPFRLGIVDSGRYRPAVDAMVASLEQQLNLAA